MEMERGAEEAREESGREGGGGPRASWLIEMERWAEEAREELRREGAGLAYGDEESGGGGERGTRERDQPEGMGRDRRWPRAERLHTTEQRRRTFVAEHGQAGAGATPTTATKGFNSFFGGSLRALRFLW